MARSVKLGVAQPRVWWGEEEERNLAAAIGYIAQAGAMGVDLLLFPENYPGPYRADHRYEVLGPLCDAARQHGVDVLAGTSIETSPGSGRFNIAVVIISREGEVVGTYRRTHPPGPYIYEGGDLWDFTYEEADSLPVFDMEWGRLGALICSEAFVPELARALALKGAELCVMPAGLLMCEAGVGGNWQVLIRARAIENLMYTATTVHLFPTSFAQRYYQADIELPVAGAGLTQGLAMIASPERVLASSTEPGLITADLDLDRIARLRNTVEELTIPMPFQTIPGVLDWRRPEVFSDVVAERGISAPVADGGS